MASEIFPKRQTIAQRQNDALRALLRALVVTPRPAFEIPSLIRRAPKGYYAVIDREGAPFLVAALDGRFVTGALTPLLGAIMRAEDPRLLGATTDETETATSGLRALGLVA